MDAANAFAVVLDTEAGPRWPSCSTTLSTPTSRPRTSDQFPGSDWLIDKAVEAGASEQA